MTLCKDKRILSSDPTIFSIIVFNSTWFILISIFFPFNIKIIEGIAQVEKGGGFASQVKGSSPHNMQSIAWYLSGEG